MAAARDRRCKQQGRCAAADALWGILWCAVWLWFAARTLGTARRILACQQFGAPAAAPSMPGRVLNAFSGDELVYNKTLGDWRTHNGVDYACTQGAAVAAPVAGKVVSAGAEGNWGTVVVLEDAAGRLWRLCGVADPAVKAGDTVTAGQKLGTVGTVGCECAEESHIHVEVKQGESYLDPAKLPE